MKANAPDQDPSDSSSSSSDSNSDSPVDENRKCDDSDRISSSESEPSFPENSSESSSNSCSENDKRRSKRKSARQSKSQLNQSKNKVKVGLGLVKAMPNDSKLRYNFHMDLVSKHLTRFDLAIWSWKFKIMTTPPTSF